MLTPSFLDLRHKFGIKGDGETNDSDAFEAALAYLSTIEGGTIVLPKPPVTYLIDRPLAITSSGTHIMGAGGDVRITQSTYGVPVFDVVGADNVTIEGLHLRHDGLRDAALLGGSFRGASAKSYCAAVWGSGNNLTVRNLRAYGFTSAVRLAPWDDDAQAEVGFADGGVVDGLAVENCDWGVVARGVRDFTVRNVRGSYSLTPNSSDPAHLIYIVGTAPGDNLGLNISNCYAFDSPAGSAYSIKGVAHSRFSNLHARSCDALLHIQHSDDSEFADMHGWELAPTTEDGAVRAQGLEDINRLHFRRFIVDVTNGTRAVRTGGRDCTFRGFTIYANRVDSSGAGDVAVYGDRVDVEDFRVINKGPGGGAAVQVTSLASTVRIRRPMAQGCRRGVEVLAGATNVSIEYDPEAISPNTTLNSYRRVMVAPAISECRVTRMDRRVVTTVSGAGTVQVRADEVTHVVLDVTTAAAFTIGAPVEPIIGASLTYEIVNSSGGALGTVTWNAALDFASAWSAPSAGERSFVSFVYDGTAWREVVR